ncbi:MAG TPA: succinate-semialdehyde dehydrogenase (NADP(+)) [Alphaproteobacteria bacterium]|nr:succinate-semialdehyde dehydrogenase (NADP(+)) [Alphaproteobacteria bacterium]
MPLTLKDPSLLRHQAFSGGEWVNAQSGQSFAVTNPATGAVLAQVPDMDESDATEAVMAAENAFRGGWAARTAKERAGLLRKWFEQIMANQEDLAQIMTAEQGKPLAESRGEVAYGASFIEWFAEEGMRVYGDIIPQTQNGRRILVLKQPIGVVTAITPWNFPNAMITRKCAPAMAAGCTIVIKPAAETPLSALALAVLAERAGIPKGVFNIITTGQAARVGRVLTQHPLVKKFSFTGSTEIGKLLMAQCATTVKKVSLELGGNAPFIVFDDADLDRAVEGAMLSKYRNMGQTCVCANRFYVQDGVYDAFAEKLTAAAAAMKVGDGTETGISQGPLINAEAVDKVERLIADATAKGAKILQGGKRHALGGTFFQPTVMSGVMPGMDILREEIFGPVATLVRFRDEAQAIQMANDSEYGLAAYFYARDLARVWRVAEALEYGIIGINEGIISTEVAPFGGWKQSGIGREGSRYGIDDYLEMKYLALGGL